MSTSIAIFLLIIISILVGYLIGSIMFSDIFGYFLRRNPRHYGSFNPGTTNSIRVFGKKYGIIVGVFDILKGLIPFLIVLAILQYALKPYLIIDGNTEVYDKVYYLSYLASFFAVIGHLWPVFFKFKGGKAVATTCGLILAVSVWWFLIVTIIWWSITLKTKLVSLASLTCFAVLPIINLIPYLDYLHWFNLGYLTYLTYQNEWFIIVFFEIINILLSVIVFIKHRSNIIRLINKTENKITDSFKKNEKK